jgi:hypothetical protein
MSVDVASNAAVAGGYDDEFVSYRAVSSTAVASLVLGSLSFLVFFSWSFGAIPIVGLVLGYLALKTIRSRPDELTGTGMAAAGMLMSVILLSAGWGWLGFRYATEVPEGHDRISYAQLQPDPRIRGQLIPPNVTELDGQKIFIKGFMYPGSRMDGIQEFVLCRDQGDCCFGGNPKLTDRIKVTLKNGKSVSLVNRMVAVAGTFHVNPTAGRDGLDGVYYTLDATHFQ